MLSKMKIGTPSFLVSNLSHLLFCFCIISIVISLYLFPGYWYSPDSFSYYELSKTFFSGSQFYYPNTIRSYFNLEHSAAFPFLYPGFIATLNLIFGNNYLNAGFYNVALMICSYFILYKISQKFCEQNTTCAVFSLSFFIYPGYIEEVLSGRSIPLAFFLLLTSILLYTKRYFYFSMYILGLACLVRFDLLAICLFIALWVSFQKKDAILLLIFGFGILPWVIYSKINFGTLWVTDNSWVALASNQSFVTDFPAKATLNIFNDTLNWAKRILYNVININYCLLKAIITNLVVALLIINLISKKYFLKIKLIEMVFLFFVINASLAPLYLSGYVDKRYFYLPIFIIGLYIFIKANVIIKNIFIPFIIILMLLHPMKKIYAPYFHFDEITNKLKNRISAIKYLEKIHNKDPNTIYFVNYMGDKVVFSAMYGALTGNEVAFPPNNKDIDLNMFNQYIGTNKYITLDNLQLSSE